MSATRNCTPSASMPAGAATSRPDRVLAPLADLGGAIRAEIAASLAPMAQEVETALERVATLEERVHDLKARLAAAAAAGLGLPIPTAQPGVEKEPAPEQTEAVAASHPVVDGEAANGAANHPENATTTRTRVALSPRWDREPRQRWRQQRVRRRGRRPRHAGRSRAVVPFRMT